MLRTGVRPRFPLSGEREAAIRERVDEAIGHEAVKGAGALDGLGPDGVEAGLRYRPGGIAQHREQAAPALTVRALVALAGRALLRGWLASG